MSKTQKISKLAKISNNKELKSSKAYNDAFVDIFKSWPFLSIEVNVKKPDGNKSSEDEKPPQAGGSSGDKQTTVPSSESQRCKDHVVQRNAQLEKQHLLKDQKGNTSIQPTNKQNDQQATVVEREMAKQKHFSLAKPGDTPWKLDMKWKEFEVAKKHFKNQCHQMVAQKEQSKKLLRKLEDEKKELLEAFEGEKKKREMLEAMPRNKQYYLFF